MIGIVILNYNSWQDTKECIESIEHSGGRNGYRIYLVDNASKVRPDVEMRTFLESRMRESRTEELRKKELRTKEPRTKELRTEELRSEKSLVLIQSPKNRGYAAGNNLGIRQALEDGCDAVLISNSDVRYYENSIDSLYEYLKMHLDIGIVGPKIFLPDGSGGKGTRLQRECMARKTGMKEKYLLRTRLHALFPGLNRRYWGREHDYERETFQVYAVLGCCFMMSLRCAQDVTPLDEHTFLYEEELILGIRMEECGWKTVYHPESEILHKHEAATGGIGRNPFAYTCQICSELYYCREYLNAGWLQLLPLYGYRVLIYMLKMAGNKNFRSYWPRFMKETKDALMTKKKHRNKTQR